MMSKIDKDRIFETADERVFLKILSEEDVSPVYVDWLNNYEVVKYTEQRHLNHTLKSVAKFVSEKYHSESEFLFGIYYNNNHVGNIKIGPINFFHKHSEISFFIGDKHCWGKGIITTAIGSIVNIAFNILDVERLTASTYEDNKASMNALLKNEFVTEGRRIKHMILEGERTDIIPLARLRD